MIQALYAGLAAIQLIGGYQQGEMLRSQAKLKQKIDEENAQEMEQFAFESEAAGDAQAARYSSVIDSTVAEQRSGYAAQGVDVNYGSAAEVQADTKITGLMNVLDIQREAREKGLGLRRQARLTRIGSGFSNIDAQMQAGAAEFNGLTSAAATGLSGYSKGAKIEAQAPSGKTEASNTNADPFYGTHSRSGEGWSEYPMWWK
jgi:hypothetical protein